MNLNNLSDEERILFAAEVEQFLSGPIARYVFDRAAENVDVATAELKEADPDNSILIRNLQYTIRLNNTVGLWLVEAVRAGQDARDIVDSTE